MRTATQNKLKDHDRSDGTVLDNPYRFAPYQLDLERGRHGCILKNEDPHCWSRIHLLLLKTLIDAKGQIVSSHDLITTVWDQKQFERPYQNLQQHVVNLRRCIAGCGDYVKTHRDAGYSWSPTPERPVFAPGTALGRQAATVEAIAQLEWARRTRESVVRALGLFRELGGLQPENPRAHLGLANCLALLGHVGFGVLPTREVLGEARLSAKRALQLARKAAGPEMIAEALSTSALIALAFDWKFSVAEQQFDEALRLNPRLARAHHWRALFLLYTRQSAEAIGEIQIAQDLAPGEPMIHGTSGWIFCFLNQISDAVRVNKETVDRFPEFAIGYEMLGLAYEADGRYHDAIASFKQSFGMELRPTPLGWLAHAYAACGKRGKAQQTLNRMLSLPNVVVSPFFFALVSARLGNFDQALALLEQARRERCDWLLQLSVDRRWEPLWKTTGFKRLLKGIGLPFPSRMACRAPTT